MRFGPEMPLSRRRLIASLGIGAGALMLPGRGLAGQPYLDDETATGCVFEDVSGDGRQARSACGIANVMVSNGRDVVLTDAQGRWSLPVRSGDTIFVIKPPHWSVARTKDRAGSSYLHQPRGTSPELGMATPVVAPTGALPASIDFALARRPEPGRFEALLLADTQPANATELGHFANVLGRGFADVAPAFAINHGDVMGDDLSLFPDYLRLIETTGFPWHHCPGNHDMNLDASGCDCAFEAWKRFIGPSHSAFQYGGATFILLNNVEYLGRGAVGMSKARYRGRIGVEQLQFVANVLRHVPRDGLVVVSMHIPLVSFEDPDSPSDTTADRRALLALLSDRPHCVSFAGHSHTTEHHYLGRGDGFCHDTPHHHHVLTAASGSWWSGPADATGVPIAVSRDGSPKGFHVLSVDGNTYETRFVPFDAGIDPVARIFTGEPCQDVLVDVFDGGPRTRVTCEVEHDPESRVQLARMHVTDPYVVDVFTRHPELCKPWVKAAPSSHIWSGAMPRSPRGSNVLIVRITDEYGRTHERRAISGAAQPA